MPSIDPGFTRMFATKGATLGESIVEATVSRWLKNEGEAVSPGDTLVELETDKITVEVPTVTGGVGTRRFVKEGETVKLDQLLAEVDEKAPASAASVPAKAPPSAPPVAAAKP